MNEPIEGEQEFQLHERLARGTFLLGRLGICQLLLKDNAEFAWLLLVPETSATELHDLTEAQYHEVCAAIRKVSQFASATFGKPSVLPLMPSSASRTLHHSGPVVPCGLPSAVCPL
jgi:diadenosine tetraphosphate (Ap4A) HIT family hydrolase